MEVFNVENVERRLNTGKSANRKLKREGMVPGIIYNDGLGIPIVLEEHELRNLLDKEGEDVILNFKFDGKQVSAKVQEVQRDSVYQYIKHIDLVPIDRGVLH